MRHFILLFVFLLTASTSLTAQDDATPDWLAAGWTYERACLPEAPTEPPANWTFDGTLLYEGKYGIHGYRAGWDSTRVMAFIDDSRDRDMVLTYSLSPDLKQIALVQAKGYWCTVSSCSRDVLQVHQLTVAQISDQNPRQHWSLPWYNFYGDVFSETGDPNVIWRDNFTLLYPKTDEDKTLISEVNTVAMTTTDLPYEILDPDYTFNSFSPDVTRYWQGSDLIDLVSGKLIKSFPPTLFNHVPYDLHEYAVLWSPDSSRFMAFIRERENTAYTLTLFDRNGVQQIPIMHTDEVEFALLLSRWSHQLNAVILKWREHTTESATEDGYRYITGIAFPDEQHFVDLCLSNDSVTLYNLPILSADGSQLAFIQRYQDSRPRFSIFDWRSGEWYLLAPEVWGGLVGWATW